MASPKIKATYSLDVESVRALEQMARKLEISKSEALRRAIHLAAEKEIPEKDERLRALDELQETLAGSEVDLEKWAKEADRLRSEGYESQS